MDAETVAKLPKPTSSLTSEADDPFRVSPTQVRLAMGSNNQSPFNPFKTGASALTSPPEFTTPQIPTAQNLVHMPDGYNIR